MQKITYIAVAAIALVWILFAVLSDNVKIEDTSDTEEVLVNAENESTRILFLDDGQIVYELLPTSKVGEDTVVPGLPNDIRKADSTFSHFSANANGEGELFFPGDHITLSDAETVLYVNWEPAILQETNLEKAKTYVQLFTKTNMTPKSYSTQGGALVIRDGHKYWVQAGSVYISEAAKENHSVDEAMNYTAIFIFDYDSGEIVNSAFNIPFGHGNDLDYNPNSDKIIICSTLNDDEDNYITEVSWDLSDYYCFTPDKINGFRIADCAYDSTERAYVLVVTPKKRNYLMDCPFVLYYSEDWQLQYVIETPFSMPINHYGFQGSCIYDGYYCVVNFLKDNIQEDGDLSYEYARLSVYDKKMSYLGSIPINVTDEIEDVSIVNGVAYFNGQRYKDGEANKFNIYELYIGTFDFEL